MLSKTLSGSLFNSHLFDFTNGWLYVVGVGVAGGVVLRELADKHGKRAKAQPQADLQ